MATAQIGIIGGSGLYQMPELKDIEEVKVETPFGEPSDAFIVGTLEGVRVAFLPRHGRGHRYSDQPPVRANIYGMKLLAWSVFVSFSRCSLQETVRALDMVIPDQFFERTRARAHESTSLRGNCRDVTFAHPVCDELETCCKQLAAQPMSRRIAAEHTCAWKACVLDESRIECLSFWGWMSSG